MKFTILAIIASVATGVRLSSVEEARHKTDDAKRKFDEAMHKLAEDKNHFDQDAQVYAKKALEERKSLKHRFSR